MYAKSNFVSIYDFSYQSVLWKLKKNVACEVIDVHLDLSREAPILASVLLVFRLICRHFAERMPVEALQRHLSLCNTISSSNTNSSDSSSDSAPPSSSDAEKKVNVDGGVPRTSNKSNKKNQGLRIDSGVDSKLCHTLFSIICKIPLRSVNSLLSFI